MTQTNDYVRAVEVPGAGGLFAVELRDGGWSVADGPGSALCEPDERDLAGWHVPVRFESEQEAVAAIKSGPHAMFDIQPGSAWPQHCLALGGRAIEAKENRG